MKKLEINQIDDVIGGDGGFWTSFACVGTLIASGVVIAGTAGAGALPAAYAAGAACGGLIGYGSASGNWF